MKFVNLFLCQSTFVLAFFLLTFSNLNFAEVNQKWYEKSFEEILNSRVVTATRNDSTLKNVPGVVTTFSSEEIKLMGLRSLKEVLERTTGFFINRQLIGATLGSRGFIADTDQFLLLIDGHNVNSIIDKGMGEQFLFPNLEYVERIEIIRGPGSTLWGSDAALGIIHVITKTGADVNGANITVNKSNGDNQTHFNLQAGKAVMEDVDFFASFTAATSDGFEPIKKEGESLGFIGNWDAIEESFELYTKSTIQNFTIKARAYDAKVSRPYVDLFNTYNGAPAYTQRTHYYIDISHVRDINDNLNIDTRFFMDNLRRTQVLMSPRFSDKVVTSQESESSQENAMGVELIARWRLFDGHNLMLGYRGVETQLSPWSYRATYPAESSAASMPGVITQFVVPEKNDVSQAIFVEDQWEIIPSELNVVAGFRLDDNNLRENKLIFLPRLSVNWQATSSWQLKYSYNTGYIRPAVGVGFLGQSQFNSAPDINKPVIGADESEEIQSHDMQVNFTKGKFRSNLNVYHNLIRHPSQIIYDDAIIDGTDTKVFYTNVGNVKTYGIELEISYLITEFINVYFNASRVLSANINSMTGKSSNGYSYDLNQPYLDPVFGDFFGEQRSFSQSTYMQNGDNQGFPNTILNSGLNWEMTDNVLSNLHVRFWDDMNMRDPQYNPNDLDAEYKLDAQFFVDINIQYQSIAGSNFDASIYAKNVLDNDNAETYLYLYSNTWLEQGRRIGASLSYTF